MANLLASLIGYAAVDSVNPCTFYVYAALVLATAATGGRRRALAAAAGFITGVYIGYFLLGIGIAAAEGALLAHLPPAVLSAALLAYAALLLYQALAEKRGRAAPLRQGGRRLAAKALRAAGHPLAAAALGLVASFTLLPCTSGPLLSFLALATSMGYTLAEIAAYLLLYNLVFVAPLAALGLAIGAAYRVRRLQEAAARHAWLLDTVTAILVAAAAILVAKG